MTRDYLATVGTDGNIGGPGGSPISPALTGFALAAAAVVATTNLALTGLQTVDGYTLLNADRILLTGQTTQSQNGLWSAASGAWTRPTDFASGAVFTGSRTVQVINGSVYAGSTWLLATNSVTVDTTAQGWQIQLATTVENARTIVIVNLLDHQVSGAIGQGSASADTAAFASARDEAVGYYTSGNAVQINIPGGLFLLNASGVFSGLASPVAAGFIWQGAGKRATFVRLVPSGSALWFYDNGATQETQFAQFRDICFEGDSTANSNGFKFTSTGQEQSAHFFECEFGPSSGLGFGGTMFDFAGSAGNDSYKFIGCRLAQCYGDVFLWNNPQAVTIELFGTNIEDCYGNIFHIGTGGGGDLHVFGGDCIMDGATASAPMTYQLQVDESNNVGGGNGFAHFYGIKFEVRSPTVGLANLPVASNEGSFDAHYHDCAFTVVNGNGLNGASVGVGRTAVIAGNRRQVHFENCQIPAEFNYELSATSSQASGNGTAGLIHFHRCGLVHESAIADDLATRVTVVNGWGRAIARDCYVTGGNPDTRRAVDFDLGAAQTAAADVSARRKLACIMPASLTWPYNSLDEQVIVLPPGSIITGVFVSKPAHGATATTYQILVGSNDKTIVYGSSISANQDAAHLISVSDLFLATAADPADPNWRTVRMWSSGGSTVSSGITGSYAFVEYI